MKILLVGAVAFTERCLRETLAAGGNVAGVLTLPPETASRHADYCDLRPLAESHGIPVHHIRHINDHTTAEIITVLAPDVMFVFGWSQLISPEVRALAPLGCIGTHPALLPRNRGRHPIVWSLVEGLERTGLTFFYLDDGVDSGDILWQDSCAITPDDDAASLYRKMEELAGEGIRTFVPQLQAGTAPRIPQDHSLATYWRKRTEIDGEIDWSARSAAIHNLIRGLSRPYVGAHTNVGDTVFRVWRAVPIDAPGHGNGVSDSPGTVLRVDAAAVHVRTGDGVLALLDYEGTAQRRLSPGVRLGRA